MEQYFDRLGESMLSFYKNVAPLAMPVAPAFFFGATIFSSSVDIMIGIVGSVPIMIVYVIAAIVAIAAAIGYESFSFMAGHVALNGLKTRNVARVIFSGFMIFLYLVIGIGMIVFVEIGDITAKISIGGIFVIAALVYFTTGMIDEIRKEQRSDIASQRRLDEEKKRQDERRAENERLADERRLEIEKLQLAQRHELDKLQAENQAEIDRIREEARQERAKLKMNGASKPVTSHNGHTPAAATQATVSQDTVKHLETVINTMSGEFGWQGVADTIGRKRGTAYAVIAYGKQTGKIKELGQNRYQLSGE